FECWSYLLVSLPPKSTLFPYTTLFKAHTRKETFGVWGDGNLGFISSLILKKLYPESKVIIFGKTDYKLNHFSFVDEAIKIGEIPEDLSIDHAVECAGGKGSQYAVDQ